MTVAAAPTLGNETVTINAQSSYKYYFAKYYASKDGILTVTSDPLSTGGATAIYLWSKNPSTESADANKKTLFENTKGEKKIGVKAGETLVFKIEGKYPAPGFTELSFWLRDPYWGNVNIDANDVTAGSAASYSFKHDPDPKTGELDAVLTGSDVDGKDQVNDDKVSEKKYSTGTLNAGTHIIRVYAYIEGIGYKCFEKVINALPQKPKALELIGGTKNSLTFRENGAQVEDCGNLRVQYKNNKGKWETVKKNDKGQVNFEKLASGKKYSFRVRGEIKGADGKTKYSGWRNFTATTAPKSGPAIKSVKASSVKVGKSKGAVKRVTYFAYGINTYRYYYEAGSTYTKFTLTIKLKKAVSGAKYLDVNGQQIKLKSGKLTYKVTTTVGGNKKGKKVNLTFRGVNGNVISPTKTVKVQL